MIFHTQRWVIYQCSKPQNLRLSGLNVAPGSLLHLTLPGLAFPVFEGQTAGVYQTKGQGGQGTFVARDLSSRMQVYRFVLSRAIS